VAVTTVLGPIRAEDLGPTCMHEHLWIDNGLKFDDDFSVLLNEEGMVLEELAHLQRAGGRTVVEVTPEDLGREPAVLRRLSEASGLNIVMGSGYYLEGTFRHVPQVFKLGTAELAKVIIAEIEEGVDGVRPGIIGEIGSNFPYLSPAEERVFRASARAHRRTGLPITTHTYRYPVALRQLDILLDEEGADPSRVIVGHLDSHPSYAYYEAVLARGAYVQFDMVLPGVFETMASDTHRIPNIVRLLKDGYGERLLISQDMGGRSHLHAFGGAGLDYLLREYVPKLEDAGVTDEQIHQILVANPAAVLDV